MHSLFKNTEVKKQLQQQKQRANEQTRRNSDQAYLYDISKIDKEAVSVSKRIKSSS
jgi:hypothetical protein